MAACLIELLGDDRRRGEIGARGRESLFPRFAPAHRARQILDLYREVLEPVAHPVRARSEGLA
jgi:hypothetical protein